jgi:hypothetical protein
MVASTANAADLPGEIIPVAVDYVKVCDTFGAGFFYIPGTETCFAINGRVRFGGTYVSARDTGLEDSDLNGDDATGMFADGRVGFDARTATEYGTLRSYLRITTGALNISGSQEAINEFNDLTLGNRGAQFDQVFIQLGYLTAGFADDLYNGDVLYGERTFATTGDQSRLQATVIVDNLGGGFFLGASLSEANANLLARPNVDTDNGDLRVEAIAGITGQTWGCVDISFLYTPNGVDVRNTAGAVVDTDDFFAVKGTANLKLIENFDIRLVAAYEDSSESNQVTLAGALKYGFSDALDIYTGLRYDIVDNDDDDDIFAANLGLDYTLTPGLVLTAEATYQTDGGFEDEDQYTGLLLLTRSW